MKLSHTPARSLVSSRLLAVGILLAVLAYSVLIGYVSGDGHLLRTLLLLAMPVGILVCVFTVKYFQFAVLLLPLSALAIPIELPTGTYSRVPISMALSLFLTVIWCISMAIRGWKIVPSPLNRPLIVFSSICVISLIWGLIWRDPVLIDAPKFIVTQIGGLAAILLSVSAAFLIGNFVTTSGQLKYIIIIFLAVCGLMAITQLLALPMPILTIGGLWGTWFIAPLYGLLIAQPKVRWWWRMLLIVALALTLYQTLIVNADWLSGWIPSVATIFMITLLRSRKAFVVLVICGAILAMAQRGFIERVADDNVKEGSSGRLLLWEQSLQVVRDHWLLGTGPAGYALYYVTYYPTSASATHNNYFDILAQFGVIGLIAWFWLSLVSLWEGWLVVQRAPPGFIRTMAIVATGGWAGALVAMFFGDWMLPFAYTQTISGYKYTVYSWIFLGTLISIRRMLPAAGNVRQHAKIELQ